MNRHPTTAHPADDLLVAWHEAPAALSPATAGWVSEHLAACAPCAARLAEFAALDQELAAWQAARPAPGAGFAAQVLAALPPEPYPRAVAGGRAGAWQPAVAAACLLAGLGLLLLSPDTLLPAGQWWQAAGAWLGSAGVEDAASLSLWLDTLPGGSLESHLGLLPGALFLGVGALLALVSSLRPAPAARPAGPSLAGSR